MDVMGKLNEAIDILNEVDEYADKLNDKLSVLDSKEQDLLHYIEYNKISILWVYRIVKEIKDIRIERRKVKQDMEILSKFDVVKNRLTSKDNRRFIMAELYKKQKQLNTVYKNRQYTDEELQNLLKGVKNDEIN